MPIINFGGAAQADIGKLYVFDGTDFDPIGKVYGFDGTDNSLIYSAEEQLFPNNLKFVGGGQIAGTVTSEYLYVRSTTSQTNSNCHSSVKVDCSQYSKLYFTVSAISLAGNATATVGVHQTGAGSTIGGYAKATKVTAKGVVEVDISDVTEELYITISCWGSSGNASMRCTFILAE